MVYLILSLLLSSTLVLIERQAQNTFLAEALSSPFTILSSRDLLTSLQHPEVGARL